MIDKILTHKIWFYLFYRYTFYPIYYISAPLLTIVSCCLWLFLTPISLLPFFVLHFIPIGIMLFPLIENILSNKKSHKIFFSKYKIEIFPNNFDKIFKSLAVFHNPISIYHYNKNNKNGKIIGYSSKGNITIARYYETFNNKEEIYYFLVPLIEHYKKYTINDTVLDFDKLVIYFKNKNDYDKFKTLLVINALKD